MTVFSAFVIFFELFPKLRWICGEGALHVPGPSGKVR